MKLPQNLIEIEHKGASMSPLLKENDFALVEWFDSPKSISQLSPGDIVVYSDQSELVAHRLIGFKSGYGFIKGDNSPVVERLKDKKVSGLVLGVKKNGLYTFWGKGGRLSHSYAKLALFSTKNIYLEKLYRRLMKFCINFFLWANKAFGRSP